MTSPQTSLRFQWLKNPVPWCVSRQLWWGHRIPAYFATLKAEPVSYREGKFKNDPANVARWLVARSPEDALMAAIKVGAPLSEGGRRIPLSPICRYFTLCIPRRLGAGVGIHWVER